MPLSSLGSASAYLKFVDCAVRFRELPSVTVLNQAEVKLDELLVVLLGNPLIDAVKSENIIKHSDSTSTTQQKMVLNTKNQSIRRCTSHLCASPGLNQSGAKR